MTFEIDIAGEVVSISVEGVGAAGPSGGRFRLRFSTGEVKEIDCRPTDLGLSIVYADDGRTVDAALTERGADDWLIQLPHVDLSATVDGRRFRRDAAGQAAGSGEQRILAPMPGRVVRVLVRPGDEVAARQGLVVVEAMKMENELTARHAGRVKDVVVAEGVSVEAGRLLVVVE